MSELHKLLKKVPDTYESFQVAVLTYVSNKPGRYEIVQKFLVNNPQAKTSDILEYISDQNDFYEDTLISSAGKHVDNMLGPYLKRCTKNDIYAELEESRKCYEKGEYENIDDAIQQISKKYDL